MMFWSELVVEFGDWTTVQWRDIYTARKAVYSYSSITPEKQDCEDFLTSYIS